MIGRTFILQTLFTLPALAMAALSGSISRQLVWTLLAFVAIWTFGIMAPRLFSEDAQALRFYLMMGFLGVGSVGALVWQFVSRRNAAATTFLLASIGMAIGTLFLWRWSFVSPPAEAFADGTRLEVRGISIEPKVDQVAVTLRVAVPANESPMEFVVRHGTIRAELTWADGRKTQVTGKLDGAAFNSLPLHQALGLPDEPRLDPETEAHYFTEAISGPQGRSKRLGPAFISPRGRFLTMFFALPIADFDRLVQTPPRCRIWVAAPSLRPELVGEVPLQAGARLSAEGIRLTIQNVTGPNKLGGKGITLRHCVFTYSQPPVASGRSLEFHVLDRPRGRAWWTANDGWSSSLTGWLDLPSSYAMRWMDVPVPEVWRTDRMVEQPEQYADFTLAAVALRPVGRWTQSLEIDRLAAKR